MCQRVSREFWPFFRRGLFPIDELVKEEFRFKEANWKRTLESAYKEDRTALSGPNPVVVATSTAVVPSTARAG